MYSWVLLVSNTHWIKYFSVWPELRQMLNKEKKKKNPPHYAHATVTTLHSY